MPELTPYREGFSSAIRQAVEKRQAEDPLSAAKYQRAGESLRTSPFRYVKPHKYPILIVAAVVWSVLSFGLVPLAAMFLDFEAGGFLTICLALVGWVVGLVLILVGGSYALGRMVAARLGEPLVNASSDRLRRGDTLDLDFIQEVKGDVNISEVRIKFYKRETVTYRRVTDTVTERHDEVYGDEVRPGRQMSRGYQINERASFRLADDAMHTFMATNNKIQYFLEVKVSIPMWPDYNETFELPVVAEVAPERE